MTGKTGISSGLYDAALDRLEQIDRRLALAAHVVAVLHSNAAAVAEPILAYLAHRFTGQDVIETYAKRAHDLAVLQQRFDADPTVANLSESDTRIDRDVYNISLLLSIALTNHRFEIMQGLDRFLIDYRGAAGRIASVGTGTGYELWRMATLLSSGWTIESYDIHTTVRADASAFLDFVESDRFIHWGGEFPLYADDARRHGAYDALIMCELLEHLTDPETALRTVRQYLAERGRLFATMAINIAQEDHVFLYRDVDECRAQVRTAGYDILSEWVTPQTTLPPPANREKGFKKGNYVVVLTPARQENGGACTR